ncbi:MAG: hypothetical protein SPD96_06755 [Paludibacteraceae bacterium]|nr:hypothetical protein [Paludibacteraceae bacterium]
MSAVILLAVLSLISIGLSVWLAVWLWRQGGRLNKIGSTAAIGAAVCLVTLWLLVGYLFYVLPLNY